MNMTISRRDVGLLLTLAGILLTVLVYKFVFENLNNKTENLQAEITTQSQVQAELQKLEANMPTYKAEITRMESENAELIKHFPSDILPEDEIMYAVAMENENEVFFRDLSYGTSELIFGGESYTAPATTTTTDELTGETTETTAPAATVQTSNSGVEGYKLVMNMSYEATYKGLKEVILYNNSQEKRMVIDGLTASYDMTSGQLSGSMTLNQYYLKGTNTEYLSPYVPNMKTGTSNIFGTNDGAAVSQSGNQSVAQPESQPEGQEESQPESSASGQ